MTTAAPDQLYGYHVQDATGNTIGDVDGVWVDQATNELEFIGVKTGWIFGKTHVMPATSTQLSGDSITVPYSEEQIKNAPSFSSDAELSPSDEQAIYDYYGVSRSTSTSPTGLASGQTDTQTAGWTGSTAQQTGGYTTDTDQQTTGWTGGTEQQTLQGEGEINVPVSEEELQVGKRQVQAGAVRLRKVVRTEHQEVPVELMREDVQIERVPVDDPTAVPDSAFQEGEIDVPLSREEPVVAKQAHVTGQVHVEKNVDTEQQTVGDEIRREEVDVDRSAGTGTVTDKDL